MSLKEFLWPDKWRIIFFIVFAVPFSSLLLLSEDGIIAPVFWLITLYLIGCFLLSAKNWRMFLVFILFLVIALSLGFWIALDSRPPCLGCSPDPATGVTICCDPNPIFEKLMEVVESAILCLSLSAYLILWIRDSRKKKPEASK